MTPSRPLWQVAWDTPGTGWAARSEVKARDAAHALKVWKREHKEVPLKAVFSVFRVVR